MLEQVAAPIISFVTTTITAWGYAGIVALMAIESASIPLPSEFIMPFAGYAASLGHLTLWGAALAGAFGCLVGSLISYAVGYYGGRPFVLKYGRYVLFTPRDLERAEHWITRWGDTANFTARLLPVVRTFVSLPAGILKMRLGRFVLYTFAGSFIWSFVLAGVGYFLGEHWRDIKEFAHGLDIVVLVALIAGIAWFVRYKIKELKESRTSAS